MTTLTLILLAVAALALLGHLSRARATRLPLRSWTPVHVADLVGAGFKVLLASGQERYRRFEAVVEDTEGRRPRNRPPGRGPDGDGAGGSDGPADGAGGPDGRDHD